MKTWEQIINKAFQKAEAKGYENIFWAIDLHETIFQGDYVPGSPGTIFHNDMIDAMQLINELSGIIILWTSSRGSTIYKAMQRLRSMDITVHFQNDNPKVHPDSLCSFYPKFYFDILLDDKAGFDMQTDWTEIKNILLTIKEKKENK